MSIKKSRAKAKADMKKPLKRQCACLQAHYGLLDVYPKFRANQKKIENFTNTYQRRCEKFPSLRLKTTTIPVVVHIVFRTSDENISDSQVKSQISALNKDFLAINTDNSKVPTQYKHLVGNARIKFKLATRDPKGKITTGITRTKTSRFSFSAVDDSVKSKTTGGIRPWKTKKYLNIWVCTLTDAILGYAQFPGGPAGKDGVVILNLAFGTEGTATAPFNKGRTTTHEIGHYLNLSHIWGESRFANCSDDDFVADTPTQFDKNFGKPNFPHVSCNNGPHGDLFMNYMDYVDDSAMFMFTHGQVARMAAALAGPRKSLGNSK